MVLRITDTSAGWLKGTASGGIQPALRRRLALETACPPQVGDWNPECTFMSAMMKALQILSLGTALLLASSTVALAQRGGRGGGGGGSRSYSGGGQGRGYSGGGGSYSGRA